MKKIGVVAGIVLLALASGCGSNYEEYGKNVMKFAKDGSLTEIIREEFDEEVYNKDDLVASVEEEVASYNGNSGNEPVDLKKCKVSDGQAVVTMEYDSAETYAEFNQAKVYQGTISTFSESEYHAYSDLKDVEGKQISLSSIVASGDEYNIIALNMDCIVEINGTICYVSGDVEFISDEAANVTGNDEAYAYIVYK